MVSVATCFVTIATLIQKIALLRFYNNLVQLVVQVQYHVNVIYSLGGRHTHTHTNFTDKSNKMCARFKK